VVVASCGSSPSGSAGSRPGTTGTTTTSTTTTTTSTTTTTRPPTTTTTSAPPSTTTTLAAGHLPQTAAFPSATTPGFHHEMADLWRAIMTGRTADALPAFFPEAAYEQVKAIADPGYDWTDRLLAEFDLDIAAAHRYLGSGARSARLLEVEVASSDAAWIPPGDCYNSVGYWHAPGNRLVYAEHGEVRSIGIASLISWRGVWYVVHLGAVLRSSDSGIVDDPTTGSGYLGPPGGC